MNILSRFERHSTVWAATLVAAMMVLALTGSSQAPAGTSILPPNAIAPTDKQRAIARKVGAILEEDHYRHVLIDDHMSSQIFDRYIESLDGQHIYFLASDLKEFEQWRFRFDDMIHTGNIEPGFAIFARYQQRNRDRVKAALKMLDTEPVWTLDESMEYDRKDAPWAATTAQLDEVWRKRVKNDGLSLLLTGKSWKDASDLLRKRYERVLKRVDQVSADDVFENFMNAYARTFDPHSNFFSPRQSEEYKITMSLNYDGIGASLEQDEDYVQVMNIIEGGPAAVAATLKPNDRITGVAQGDGPVTDVVGWRLDDVVQLIRGKAGTVVRLQVLPAGATPGSPEKMLVFTRNKVNLDKEAAKQEIRTVNRGGRMLKIGIITIPSFYQDVDAQSAGDPNFRSTTRDVHRLLGELSVAGVDGIVLDLRDDGGGFLPEATALTGLFIDKGPVVQLKDTNGRVEVLDDPDSGVTYSGPLSVLVNRYSASASEIFAGALQDYHRAYILGQRTFGKGTVQNLIPLDRWSQKPTSGQITVTIGKFYRVTGESTQHRGVEPDVQLPSVIDMKEVGESSLEAALPWDRIPSAAFTTWRGDEHPAIAQPALVTEEAAREQHDPDYRWLVSEVAALNKERAEKTLSLNLKVREDERTELDKERLDRANQRLLAEGQPAVPTVEELDKGTPPDLVLGEATQVMADILTGESPDQGPASPPAQTVQR
jgi:carboxyl-terminal processing protease